MQKTPNDNFLPATGVLAAYQPPLPNLTSHTAEQLPIEPTSPAHIRIDSGVVQGDEIGIYYDPMFAKLICKGNNRQAAIQLCQRALRTYFIAGVTTNLNFLQSILCHPAFMSGDVTTHFIQDHDTDLLPRDLVPPAQVLMSLAAVIQNRQAQNSAQSSAIAAYWRPNLTQSNTYRMSLDSTTHEPSVVTISTSLGQSSVKYLALYNDETHCISISPEIDNHAYTVTLGEHRFTLFACEYSSGQWCVLLAGQHYNLTLLQPDYGEHSDSLDNPFIAPMNGTVVHIPITAPCHIKQGDTVMVIEAMKMEHKIVATCSGEITEIFYHTGDLVSGGANLVNFITQDSV